jgi:hypothetical protein
MNFLFQLSTTELSQQASIVVRSQIDFIINSNNKILQYFFVLFVLDASFHFLQDKGKILFELYFGHIFGCYLSRGACMVPEEVYDSFELIQMFDAVLI